MDQRNDPGSGQEILDFDCKKIIHSDEKSASLSPPSLDKTETLGQQTPEHAITLQTPEKTNELSPTEREAKVPEKYKLIAEFFHRMGCSLRLLGLRKKLPTFQNICCQVEVLTKRKFLYKHLAQMKYILPEAMQIDKILVCDEETLCMKADMKITLLFDVVEGHDEPSDYMALHKVFASRLMKFFATHPEACEIPEALLPEPFCQETQITITEVTPVVSQTEGHPTLKKNGLLSEASHIGPSFNRHFSQEVVAETENIVSAPSVLLPSGPEPLNRKLVETSPQKEYACLHFNDDELANKDTRGEVESSIPALLTPHSAVSCACKSPVVKQALPADKIVVGTPAQLTPKRLLASCEEVKNTFSQNRTSSNHKPAKRCLEFLHLEDDAAVLGSIADDSACNKVLHDSIPQQVLETKETSEEENFTVFPAAPPQKVVGNVGCLSKDQKISETGLAWSELCASLPDFVASIQHIFKSANSSSMTKEELVHKIIMNNCDVTERGEAEEQIELLEKLVPDWICRKLAPSGDTVYTIKKVCDLGTIKAELLTR